VLPPGGKGRTIAALVAHLHNCGLRYLAAHRPRGRPGRARSLARHAGAGGARYGWKMMGGTLVDLLARIP
jgi:hypothetical protein